MHIKKILSRSRRDFTAIYVCEHCNHETEQPGYDDEHFHGAVIPKMKCGRRGKTAGPKAYPNERRAPKYPDGQQV